VLWDEASSPALLRGTRRTLVEVLETVLRAAHPIIPFITEAIWQRVREPLAISGDTVMLQDYPLADDAQRFPDDERALEWVKSVVTGLRNIRGEMNVAPSRAIDVLLQAGNAEDRALSAAHERFLGRLCKLQSMRWLDDGEAAPMAATALVGDLRILVPMAGLIDVAAERGRLDKEIARRAQDVERLRGKLGNESFTAKAPADVVAKEREKLADGEQALATLREQRVALDAL
jgi:valyl-tRNA synthetase